MDSEIGGAAEPASTKVAIAPIVIGQRRLGNGTSVVLVGLLAVTACSSEERAATGPVALEPIGHSETPRTTFEEPRTGSSQAGLGTPSERPVDNGWPANGIIDDGETDIDCGGPNAPPCGEGKNCTADTDCIGACSYSNKCVDMPSCKSHLGGDTCGALEVGEAGAQHESCCRTLPVRGFTDPTHPNKTVYLDKYEITAGRVRAFVEAMTTANGGKPDVKAWIATHRPAIWDRAWEELLPTGWEGPSHVVNRRLLGDPTHEDSGSTDEPPPWITLPPATDEARNFGMNHQFGSEIYAYLHGNNCAVFDQTWGFPTYFYAPEILQRNGQLPRANGTGFNGEIIPANELLDVKAMNCITNAMLAAFCAWDGGQLATDEVLDYVTASPSSLGSVSGCGTQHDEFGELIVNDFRSSVQSGGRCAPVAMVNATFDAGDMLPVENSPLNAHNYHFPDLGAVTHDKAWQVSAPGRATLAATANGQTDLVRIDGKDEPWVDLHGNLNEAAFETRGGEFTGRFALKFRGLGYGSARAPQNGLPIKGEPVVRIQRPDVKAAYTGGRCMRFR